jgi:hypothetical protein
MDAPSPNADNLFLFHTKGYVKMRVAILVKETPMKSPISSVMIVVGVGLLVLGFSDYVPAGSGEPAGWSESCRYAMTVGAMLAIGGLRIP